MPNRTVKQRSGNGQTVIGRIRDNTYTGWWVFPLLPRAASEPTVSDSQDKAPRSNSLYLKVVEIRLDDVDIR